MPVSGNEIASLDFANLIGGPLDAIIRAQAKSALATAQFIKEVGFDKNGKVVNADFSYSKVEGKLQRKFTLSVPLLSMLPVPYIMVTDSLIEFTAKISSTTQTEASESNLKSGSFSAKANYWFVSASVTGKASSQKNTARTDKEQRTFDMKIVVRSKNAEIASGTERLLTMIEQAMKEESKPDNLVVYYKIISIDDTGTSVLVESENREDLKNALNAGTKVVFTFVDPDKQPPSPGPDYTATQSKVDDDPQNPNSVKVTVNAPSTPELIKKVRDGCVGRFLNLPIPK